VSGFVETLSRDRILDMDRNLGLVEGEVFRKIERWGNLAPTGLHPGSLIPLLREIFAAAGIEESGDYSSHSLRRGFAGWAGPAVGT
jgi:hypothetical protein